MVNAGERRRAVYDADPGIRHVGTVPPTRDEGMVNAETAWIGKDSQIDSRPEYAGKKNPWA
jgi:hypothetical protein